MSQKHSEASIIVHDFHFPEDMTDKEIVLIRVPADVPLSALQGSSISLTKDMRIQTKNGGDYTMQYAEDLSLPVGILVKDQENLKLSKYVPTKQMQLIPTIPTQTETKLAPRPEVAPEPSVEVRHAYTSVPAKQGLVRRWTPIGGNVGAAASAPPPITRSTDPVPPKKGPLATPSKETADVEIRSASDSSTSSEKRKKSAKKSEKKAKKEAKRAKKEAKKRRKSQEGTLDVTFD